MIYLDNAATTRISDEVLDEMLPYLKEQYGNPGGVYEFGQRANEAVSRAREKVAAFLRAETPDQIIFTASGSEANAMVFAGVEEYLRHIGKRKIIISAVEHESVTKSAEKMCMKHEFDLQKIGVNSNCMVSLDSLKDMLTEDVGLVSVMYVNNETGAVNSVKEISKMCKQKGILFHTDCVQAASNYPIDVKEIGCDFLTISAHKLHACKGTGALYVKDKSKLQPLVSGGRSQEFGLRGGTENVPGIVAMGKACELLQESDRGLANAVRNEFIERLKENMTNIGLENRLRFNGLVEDGLSKIVSVTVKNIDAETLILLLGSNGVCVSAGSACNSTESVPSHVLLAMGVDEDEARSTIRVSFSNMNTIEEADLTARIFTDSVLVLEQLGTSDLLKSSE